MKKLFLSLSIFLGTYTYGQAYIAFEPLSAEKFDRNFYVGQVGFYLPQENYLEVAQEYFLANDLLGIDHFQTNALYDVLQKTEIKPMLPIKEFMPTGQERLRVVLGEIKGRDSNKLDTHFACLQYLSTDCVSDILEIKQNVQENIENNRILIDRLHFLISNSDYIEPIFASNMSISGNNYPLGSLYRVYVLSLSEAILNLDAGNIEKGLEQLQMARKRIEIAYHPKSKPLLFDLAGIVSETQALDQTMNGLLNSGLLNDSLNNPSLENVLKPYSFNALLTIQKSLFFEIRDALLTSYRAYLLHDIDVIKEPNFLTEEDEYLLLLNWQDSGVVLSPAFKERLQDLSELYTINQWESAQRLNQLNEQIDKIVQEKVERNIGNIETVVLKGASSHIDELAVLQKEHDDLIQAKHQLLEKHMESLQFDPYILFAYLNNKYPSDQRIESIFLALDKMEQLTENGVLVNLKLHKEILDEYSVIREDFLEYEELIYRFKVRFLEQQNYHQLVYLKYLIMKNNISDEEIPEFLKSNGDLAKNIMTKEPYHFDSKRRILWTPLPDNKYIPALIRSARWQNYDIRNYEVYVPNL